MSPSAAKPKVLLFGLPFDPSSQQSLEAVADVTIIPRRPYDETVQNIARAVKEHGPFVVFGFTITLDEMYMYSWTKEMLEPLAPDCKCYCRMGAGYDMVDVEYITSTGAYFANAPVAPSSATAEGALALLLQTMKAIGPQEKRLRSGQWGDFKIRTLDWKTATIGIVGLGNLGSNLARMCSALGFRVVYNTRSPRSDVPYEHVPLEDLWARSDAIVLACPLTSSTRGLVCKDTIARMRDGVILVNVSRGPVVVEDDLVEALNSGKVLRVALDVFEHEPQVHPGLLANPDVTLTPHCAAGFDVAGIHGIIEMVDNVVAFFKTGRPNTPVNEHELNTGGKLAN